MNLAERVRLRAQTLADIRAFFAARDVLEVQTAVLAPSTVTDPDVESIAVPGYGFLQTSPEYQMKRLLSAGAPSIYQLGPVFRHEERGRLHNPEFTMLEWYRLGFDDQLLMQEVADLVAVYESGNGKLVSTNPNSNGEGGASANGQAAGGGAGAANQGGTGNLWKTQNLEDASDPKPSDVQARMIEFSLKHCRENDIGGEWAG